MTLRDALTSDPERVFEWFDTHGIRALPVEVFYVGYISDRIGMVGDRALYTDRRGSYPAGRPRRRGAVLAVLRREVSD